MAVIIQRSKRYKEAAKKATVELLAIDKGIEVLKTFAPTKFDQSVELIFSLGEENIEGRKRTVASRNVLLHLHFLVVSELRMAVDALFEHAKAITNHDDFVKERIDGDPPLLEAFLAGLEDDFSSFPLSGELDRAHPELVAEHLRQHFAKLFGVHF